MDTTVLDGKKAGPGLGELLETARDAFRRGRLSEAEQTCQSILDDDPVQPDAWFIRGSAALREGRVDAACSYLERAVEMRRGSPPYRIMLAKALRARGDTEGAHRHFHDAGLIDPRSHEAAFGLMGTCAALGRKADAAFMRKQSTRLLRQGLTAHLRRRLLARLANMVAWLRTLPGQPRRRAHTAAMTLGNWLVARQEDEYAYQTFLDAHRTVPDDPRALLALSRIAFDFENFTAALEHAQRAHEIAPDNTDTRCAYGRVLSRMAQHDRALDLLERAHLDAPEAFRPLLLLGWARYRAGQTRRAIADFDAVLEQQPRSVEAHYGRARALIDAGEIGEGKRWLHRTVALSPGHAGALRELANLKEISPDSAEFARIEHELGDDTNSAHRRLVLHRGAGAACHAAAIHDEAFDHYRTGNMLKDVVFDIDAYSRHTGAIMDTFDETHFALTREWGNESEVPVFIVGMPRSGTSLVEQILASHPNAYGAGEREEMLQLADRLPERLNDTRAYPGCVESLDSRSTADIAGGFLSALRRLDPNAERIADKMPGNFHHVGLIATLFPNAAIVHCRRDPRDTCLSIYFGEFAGSHNYAYDLTNLGRYYRQYERIMAHWHRVLPGRILDIAYEDMVNAQEDWSRKLIAHCGLEWDPRCLDFHKTARTVTTRSNAQVRQPIYRSSIERWRPYESQLAPLLAALEEG